MKVAVLADIHANLEALEAVLIEAEKERAERIFSLGDVVGYGADPAACLYRLQEVGAVCVLGNHDQAMVDLSCVPALNLMARDTLLRSRPSLRDEDLEFLRSFAYRHVEFGGVFVHANPIRPEDWQALFLHTHIEWCMRRLDWNLCFVGHTHYPGIYCRRAAQTVPLTSAQTIVGPHGYLVNVGSVGQPRDGDARAAYALWDLDRQRIEVRRVEYALQRTQEKMAQAGWPPYLAARLARGE